MGLAPYQDSHWITHLRAEAMRLLAERKIDAHLGFPPNPQALRAKQVGDVMLNRAVEPQRLAQFLVGKGIMQ